jgi:hypothetical protein
LIRIVTQRDVTTFSGAFGNIGRLREEAASVAGNMAGLDARKP